MITFLCVKPVAPLLVCFWGVVKPLAPLLAENGCFSGETARQWCHWLHVGAAWCCQWCYRFRVWVVGLVTVVLLVSIEGLMVVTVVPLVSCAGGEVLAWGRG